MNSRILRAFIWFSENSYFNEKFWKSYKRWIRKNPTDFRAFPRKWQLRLEMKFLKILRIQPSLSRWKITFQFILGLKSPESNLPIFFSRWDIQYNYTVYHILSLKKSQWMGSWIITPAHCWRRYIIYIMCIWYKVFHIPSWK